VKEIDGFLDLGGAGANRVVCRGNLVALHKLLGEGLARFKTGSIFCRTEDTKTSLLKRIDDSEREGQLRSDDCEAGLLQLGEAHHGGHIFEVDRKTAGNLGDTAIARRANHFGDSFAALDRPGERMFATA
jgi:hypothetical protein